MPSSSPDIDLPSEKDNEDVAHSALANGPGSGWLVGTHRAEDGAGNWGQWGQNNGGWNQSRRNSWDPVHAEDNPFPDGTLVELSMNHVRQDLRMALLTWHGRSDRPAHLDGEESERWAQIQLHACSLVAQHAHAPFPTFTGPQIESWLASVEEELVALDERRKVEKRVEQLEDTSKHLRDLYGGKRTSEAQTQLSPDAGSLITLNNIQSDFNDKGRTWAGKKHRDTSLNNLNLTLTFRWPTLTFARLTLTDNRLTLTSTDLKVTYNPGAVD
ncbi:hypothetical protein BT96DRAFT_998752 [Gymnopus androsaceus JB14]|uniref:Uncharacterized protein n=1 Tax=Gymnopus androsaceus JB14 TaxID=1447944 RepID=A0A6A4H7N0_9AGAR|nr:hypothetical protein BT96DRAFT_998752 [Gymnopus androsaceus JB14]